MTEYPQNRFEGLIGQQAVKNKLNFYIDVFHSNDRRYLPFLLFSSPKGYGKTEFAKTVAMNLENADGTPRKNLLINSSTIRNNVQFFENIFFKYMVNDSITIIFDEAHALPSDFVNLLLTLCNPDDDTEKNIPHDGAVLTFDFSKISFMFATTEPDKLFPPLKDRLESIEFKPYSDEELGKIAEYRLSDIEIGADDIKRIVSTTRGNPRSIVKRTKDIENFCARKGSAVFGASDFEDLCKTLDILPHGVSNNELTALQVLKERGECSLTMLTSVTGMSKTALQRDVEHYLMKKGFMEINPKNSKRKITRFGQILVEKTASKVYNVL